MTIVRKPLLKPFLDELDEYHQRLRAVVEGSEPSANLAAHYHSNPEHFQRDYTDVDMDELEKAIKHFKVSVDHLKKIKSKAAKPIHRP